MVQERDEAARIYGESPVPQAADASAPTFEPEQELAAAEAGLRPAPVAAEPAVRKGPTPEQLTGIKAAIANASTLEEVQRLEEALKAGLLPSGISVGGAESGQNGAAAMEEG